MSGTYQAMAELEGVCGEGIYMVRFQFAPVSGADPAAGSVTNGRGSNIGTIKYGAATGLYTVTLVDLAPGNFLGGACAVRSTAAGNMRGFSAEFDGTNGNETAGVVSVAIYNTSNALANVTAGTGEVVYGFLLFSKNPLTTN